jgi:hypothetical protein
VLNSAQLSDNDEQRTREQLVAIRADVLADAEHALGNLLQRMYHVARVAREGLGPHADRLNGALGDLERVLELVFDYVSPVEVELRPTAAARVAESLAGQVRDFSNDAVSVRGDGDVRVMADARLLRRAFQLLARGLAREWQLAGPTAIVVSSDATSDRCELSVRCAVADGSRPTDGNLALAVAGRLIDLLGGEIHCDTEAGELVCRVILPVVKQDDDCIL